MRHDFKARFQRIVAVDKFQMRLSAIEKRGEETLEMAVHCLERGEEASAAFAIQTTDGTAKAVDGLPQFAAPGAAPGLISEERRVGKGCVSKGMSRWSAFH